MRFRFSTYTLLLSTTLLAVTMGVMVGWARLTGNRNVGWFLATIVFVAPLWLPFVFIAFAIGRRCFTTRLAVVYVVSQIVACGLAYFVQKI